MTDGHIQTAVGAFTQPRILFKPVSWLAKIDFINHLILFNNALVHVVSEKEGGKTSFATLLQDHLDQQIKSISMRVTAPCDRHHFIDDVANKLHLNHDTQTDIASIVAQINERKAHTVLIIDDAHHLPELLLKELLLGIKKQEHSGFFHICLISDYSLVATLNQLTVEQSNNLVHTIELGLLTENEARTYILQRAMSQGLINHPLSDAQLKQFYQVTKGDLAKINSGLELFIFNCTAKKKRKKISSTNKISLTLCALVMAGLSLMYFYDTQTSGSLNMVSDSILPSIKQVFGTKDVMPIPKESYIASWQDSSTRQLVHYALPKVQVLDEFSEEEPALNTVAVLDKVVVIPTVKTAKIIEPVETPQQTPPTVAQQSIAPEPVKVEAQKLAEQTLYTIQLIASHQMSDINRFKQNNKLFANTRVRHFTNDKGTWYVLTLGEYTSKTDAQEQVNQLPAELSKLNPWIQSIAGLAAVG